MSRASRRMLFPALLWLVACSSAGNDGTSAGGPVVTSGDAGTPGRSDGGTGTGWGDAAVPTDGAPASEDAGHGLAGDGAASAEASSDAGGGSMGPYGGDGPATVTTATFQVPSPNGTFATTAYIPGGTGPFPVVVLSSGFFQPGAAYAPYANRLASWGMVTFLRDDPNLGESTANVASDVAYTVATWLAATNADSTSALYGKVDASRVGLVGHSRGGQIALLAAEGGAMGKIQGVFGLDPVDSSQNGTPQARSTLSTIGVALAFLGETTDSGSSDCAPAADNYQVLYQAAASPAVALTAVGADHTMFENPTSCFACTVCTAGTANKAQVLSDAVRYVAAFFARQLLGDATVGAAFDGAGASQDIAAGAIQLTSK